MNKRAGLLGRFWLLLVVPFALLTAGCLPAGIKIPQSEFSSVVERKAGLIAYLATDGNIYTVDQGGSNLTPITSDAHIDDSGFKFYGLPIWSPNSESLAFASYEGEGGAQTPSSMGLVTAGKDGSSLTQAHKSADYLVFYYWSPTSDQLGFISSTPNQGLALRTVSSSGGEAQLVDVGSPYYWAWSPDGRAMMSHVGGSLGSEARLSLLQLGPEVVEYGLDVELAPFKAPAFSPDGSQVLVAGRTEAGTNALMVMDVFGRDARVLTEFNGNIAFAWSPNGRRVAYLVSPSDDLGSPGTLGVIDPAGKADPIAVENEDVYAFFWSPDSQSIAYFVDRPQEDAQASSQQQNFIWGLYVLDAANGRTHAVQETLVATQQFLQVIPYFDQYQRTLNIWSPDSKNLVVSAYRPDGTPTISVMAASGNLEPRYIADGLTAVWSPK